MSKQEPEEDDNADDTGDYMPPLLQGHRVTLEGKLMLTYLTKTKSRGSTNYTKNLKMNLFFKNQPRPHK